MDLRRPIGRVLALILAEDGLPRRIFKSLLPVSFRSSFGPTSSHEWVAKRQAHATRWLEPVDFGNLRRLRPISVGFGYRRGKLPIDRYYIERFLMAHSSDIRGRVLEIEDNRYTCKFGGDRVVRSDVLHVVEGNPKATIVDDLTRGLKIRSNTFDCIILTHTLQCIYDVQAAVITLHRILRPGGVVLAAIPGMGKISRWDMDRWGDYWRFTTLSARRLFEAVFPATKVEISAYGNVLAAIANLEGLAAEELVECELNHCDPDFELTITIRAVKPSSVEITSQEKT